MKTLFEPSWKLLLVGAGAMTALLTFVMAQGNAPGAPAAAEEEADDDFPPRKFDARRYDAIFQKDPFMNEVAIEAKEEEKLDEWAKGLVIRAVTRITGKYVVHVEDTTLKNEKDPEKLKMRYHRLVEGDNSAQLRVQSVRPHRDPTQVEVVVLKGAGSAAQTATIKYNEKEIVAKAAARPPVNRAPNTSRSVPTPTRGAKPATTTRRPTTTPGKRRVIMPPGLK